MSDDIKKGLILSLGLAFTVACLTTVDVVQEMQDTARYGMCIKAHSPKECAP